MSEKIDKFCENLRGQLNNIESQLFKVSENVKAAPKQAADSVRASCAAAKEHHANNVKKMTEAKQAFDERLRLKKEEVESQIQEWKTNREISKLENRADNAEGYAIAAIEFAAAATAEADLATLEAIVARMDAEEVVVST